MQKKQKRDLYEPIEFDVENEQPSRTQLKRESRELQQLGLDFAALGRNVIKEANLPPLVEEALLRLKTIAKHEARRRHLQYIGKLMRTFDITYVRQVVEAAEQGHTVKTAEFHRLEIVREQLIEGDDALFQEYYNAHPEHGQRLRQLVLGARREQAKGKPPKDARALFKLLRELPLSEEEEK
ncbi:MAG: DUF615 domain-containing protein [Pseudodesulfovibrio sp.]